MITPPVIAKPDLVQPADELPKDCAESSLWTQYHRRRTQSSPARVHPNRCRQGRPNWKARAAADVPRQSVQAIRHRLGRHHFRHRRRPGHQANRLLTVHERMRQPQEVEEQAGHQNSLQDPRRRQRWQDLARRPK